MKVLWRIIEILVNIIAVILGLACIGIVGLVATIYYFDINDHRMIIEQQYLQITGDELKLNGLIKVQLTPTPTFYSNDVILNVTSPTHTIKLSADKLSFKINPKSIFQNDLHLYDVKATKLTLALSLKGKKTQKEEQTPYTIVIDKLNGTIDTSKKSVDLTKLNVVLAGKTIKGELHLLRNPKQVQFEANLTSPEWTIAGEQSNDLAGLLSNEKVVGKLKWQFGVLSANDISIKNAIINMDIEPKKIEATMKGDIAGGKTTADIHVSQEKSVPQYNLNMDMDLNNPALFLKAILPEAKLEAQGLKLHIVGDAQGSTIEAIRNSFQGNIQGSTSALVLKSGGSAPARVDKRSPRNARPTPNDNTVFPLKSVEFNIKMLNNKLDLSSHGLLPGGGFKGDFWIKDWKTDPYIITDVSISANNTAEFLQSVAPGLKLTGGIMTARLQGKTQGKHFEEWKDRFKGHLFMHIQNITVMGQSIDARLVDVLALFWKMFIPSPKETLFECVASRFIVHDGILLSQDSFAVETPEIYALGTGSIDFMRDWLNLTFDVYPRSKIPLQIGAYDNTVSIRGPFHQPKVETSGNGLIAKGGSIALGIATSGISTLVEKFIQIVRQRGSPCAKVLGEHTEEAEQFASSEVPSN